MIGCLLWLILFAISWPIALLFVVIYPLVWLLLLPLSLLGMSIAGILAILRAIILWPLRFF
ncbi:MAG: hypothetical protein KGZ92_08080 [Firmicutes bacterium]|nr:hypothetical protein [Dethiobacter sp.]MBS3889225.1 hypothetical protein [Bacillota bacterium]MBS4053879.1 hypothetical protein [Thermaerobacter sp.]